ncbi:MAG: hypothetical protein Q9179_002689 [Wetmoreana sp. 5 TL-2023]
MRIFGRAQTLTAAPPRKCNLTQKAVPDIFQLGRLKDQDLYEITVDQLQRLFSEGSLTSLKYVEFCLRRIRTINPYLEAIIEVNPDAADIAAELDDERLRGKVRGSLHGVPVLVKDVRWSSPHHPHI